MEVFLRTPHNYDMRAAGKESAIVFDPSDDRTKQEFKDETNINVIMKRYGVTGEWPQTTAFPQSGDFVAAASFHEAMNVIAQAQQAFSEVPSHIRARFENDPAKFEAFLRDDKNRDEAVRLGLVPKPIDPVEAPPMRVEVVNPAG